MKNGPKVLTLVLASLCFVFASGQNARVSALDSLAGNFIKALRANPQEKIFLHTDKWFYLSGETIWFKAYSLNSLSNKVSIQSKILFVDLVDEHDRVVHQVLLDLPQRKMQGNIGVPADLPEGYYWLRAYTRKILDEDSMRMFVQPIYVLNPRKPDSAFYIQTNESVKQKAQSSLTPPRISFFPEGGTMISGTNTQIAFKSQDAQGNPLDISGYVTDNLDSVVATFTSSFHGLGRFFIDVYKSRKYTAHVRWKNKQLDYPFPPINQYASQLSVIDQDNNTFRIRVSLGDSLYHRNKIHSLLGISRDSVCFAATGTDMYEITLSKVDFPRGPATLLLFDEHEEVVSERNIYVDRDNHIFSVITDKPRYGAREKARFEFTLTDSMQHPLRALCSVSITDDNMDKPSGLESSVTNFSLASLNMPQAPVSYSREEIDLLMLTQKPQFSNWRHFHKPRHIPTQSYLEDSSTEYIRGRILNRRDEPVAAQTVSLFSTQRNIIFMADTTDKQGRFDFHLPPGLADSSMMTLQVSNEKALKLDRKIAVDPYPFPHPSTPVALRKKFDASRHVFLRDFKAIQMDTTKFGRGKEWLKEVTVMGARKKQLNYDERKRLSQFSSIITSDMFDKGGMNVLGTALLSAPGIHLKGAYVAVQGGFGFGHPSKTEPLLVVDGIPVIFDTTQADNLQETSRVLGYLSTIPASNVDFIEILSGPDASVYGARGAFGVICVNTSPLVRHDDEYAIRGLKRIFTRGFSNSDEFIMPDYSTKEGRKSAYNDQRPTLYWNPVLLTDEHGKAAAEFYTSDPATTYTFTMEGITENGSVLFRQVKIERK